MAYLRVWIHLVWSTKYRDPLISSPELRRKLFAHIVQNAAQKGIYLDCVNGSCDHVHALVSVGPDQNIAKIAQLLKGESSHWFNKQNFTNRKFEWQNDYFACSVSEFAVQRVRRYIANQEEHHRKHAFSEEYEKFMELHGLSEIVGTRAMGSNPN